MTKLEFLVQLERRLIGLDQAEVKRQLAYYAEMLEDRMEDGMSEAEAVESMGDVDVIAAGILGEVQPLRVDNTSFFENIRNMGIQLLDFLSGVNRASGFGKTFGDDMPHSQEVACDGIHSIIIKRPNGSVEIRGEERENILIGDGAAIQFENQGGTLRINAVNVPGAHNLCVAIPLSMDENLQLLRVSGVSADVSAEDILAHQAEFSTASGDCRIAGCAFKDFSFSTASGDFDFDGACEKIRVNSASGDMDIALRQNPSYMDAHTVSGDITLHIPQDCGFTLAHKSTSGDLTCDFSTLRNGRLYVHGDGHSNLNLSSVSGDTNIHAM